MERLESGPGEDSIETVTEPEADGGISVSPGKLPDEEYLSLEYEDYSLICSTTTPSFDEVSEIEETNDTPFWVVGEQVYNEFQWSDSDQSEIDFELSAKPTPKEDGRGPSQAGDGPKKNKIKYIIVKSGNTVKKIRVNITDLSNTYLDRVKRLENYKKFLKMIGKGVEKGEDFPVGIDASQLQGMTEEEKAERKQLEEELAQVEREIQTLKEVLRSKNAVSQKLKKQLGVSVWKEITDDISQGVRNVKESNVYQNVGEKINQWGKAVADAPIYQKTETVVKATAESTRSLFDGITGGFTQKIGQLKSSESFRSFEEKVGSAYENVKTKVASRSSSMQNFDDVLREENMMRSDSLTSPTIPEGKALP